MKYYENRGKIFKRAYIVRQRAEKTRYGIEKGKVFTMVHLWRYSFGLEHKSNHKVYNW